jgi:hypothetical protein
VVGLGVACSSVNDDQAAASGGASGSRVIDGEPAPGGTGGTAATGGAGGTAGSDGGGGSGWTGGSLATGGAGGTGAATCGRMQFMHDFDGQCLPPTDPSFSCAGTYDEQTTATYCIGLGTETIVHGACGSGWAWTCRTGVTNWVCIYDDSETLVKAWNCSENNCYVSSDLSTDGGPACDVGGLVDG